MIARGLRTPVVHLDSITSHAPISPQIRNKPPDTVAVLPAWISDRHALGSQLTPSLCNGLPSNAAYGHAGLHRPLTPITGAAVTGWVSAGSPSETQRPSLRLSTGPWRLPGQSRALAGRSYASSLPMASCSEDATWSLHQPVDASVCADRVSAGAYVAVRHDVQEPWTRLLSPTTRIRHARL